MAFPKKFKPLLDLSYDQVEKPTYVWLVNAVCAVQPDSCEWEGWVLDGVLIVKRGNENPLPSDQFLNCPRCRKALFRTEVYYKFDMCSDQTGGLVEGQDYTSPPMLYYPDTKGITSDTYDILCGIWDTNGGFERTTEREFSWGPDSYRENGSVVIDLGHDPPLMYFPSVTDLIIEEVVTQSLDTYNLHLRSKVEDSPSDLITVHTAEDGLSLWFEENDYITWGRDTIYYRRSGPK